MSRPRLGLGIDPLDALLGGSKPSGRTHGRAGEPSSRRKVRATFHLPLTLVDAARDATVALSGPPTRLTLARLVENGIRRELQDLRDRHNGGEEFPRRADDLMGGRPIAPFPRDGQR
jgi:hypothetical protein